MNKKQLKCMWCGIAADVLVLFFTAIAYSEARSGDKSECLLIGAFFILAITLVTGGLLVTFKDNEQGGVKVVNKILQKD